MRRSGGRKRDIDVQTMSRPAPHLTAFLTLAACAHAGPPSGEPAPPASPVALDAGAPAVEADSAVAPDAAAAASAVAADTAPTAAPTSAPVFESSGSSYPADSLKATFEQHGKSLLACYEPGRKRNPQLRGRVIVRFSIRRDGRPKGVADNGSNLEDSAVIACVVKAVSAMRFAKPTEGNVTVTYPIIFHSWEPYLVLPDSAPP